MVECSPATRAARVRFPDDARLFVNPKSIQNTWQSPKKQVLYYEYFCFLKLPPSCRQFSKKPFNSITLFRVDGSKKFFCKKVLGGAGYRSRYLSHAKRALYHLSYAPSIQSGEELRGVDLFTWSDIYAQGQPGTSCGYTPKVFPDATNKPSIAQLVERWTVVVLHQKSIGRWFKSGSKEFLTNHVTICGHDQSWPLQSSATSQVPR